MLNPLQSTRILTRLHNASMCKYDFVRCLSVSNLIYTKYRAVVESQRSVRMMQKLLTGTKHFARRSVPPKPLSDFGFMQTAGGGSASHKPVSGKLMRRVDMLNNLFVENITSLLATGEVAPEFLGLGIQISKVKITPDFSAVNVYWYATGTEKDEVIEKLMAKSSGHLRHLLSQLRVVGLVPPINFYKDKTYSKLQEVEALLSKCDLGPAVVEECNNNADEVLGAVVEDSGNVKKVDEIKKKKDFMEDAVQNVMSHDILGVRHDFIMKEIKNSLQKKVDRKRAREQNIKMSSISSENSENESVPMEAGTLEEEVKNHRQRQREFLKYLKQQQAEKSKELRRQSVQAKEDEFYRSVIEERKKNQMFNRLDELDDLDEEDVEDESKYNDAEERYYENLRESFK